MGTCLFLEGKFRRMIIRSMTFYHIDYWATERENVILNKHIIIRTSKWMCGHGIMDKMRNEDTSQEVI